MHIFMRIVWGKNIPLNSITNQRAALDLCRASPECIFLGIWFKIKRHNTVYISRSQKCWCSHARVHLVSISSIVPAVCTRSARDLISPPGGHLRVYRPYKKRSYRPLPSSKNPHSQNDSKCTTFLVKMSVICIIHFHIKGWALKVTRPSLF